MSEAEYKGPIRILVVDDEPDLELLIRQKFRREIRDKEMDFDFASDGQVALNRVAENGHLDKPERRFEQRPRRSF